MVSVVVGTTNKHLCIAIESIPLWRATNESLCKGGLDSDDGVGGRITV